MVVTCARIYIFMRVGIVLMGNNVAFSLGRASQGLRSWAVVRPPIPLDFRRQSGLVVYCNDNPDTVL